MATFGNDLVPQCCHRVDEGDLKLLHEAEALFHMFYIQSETYVYSHLPVPYMRILHYTGPIRHYPSLPSSLMLYKPGDRKWDRNEPSSETGTVPLSGLRI